MVLPPCTDQGISPYQGLVIPFNYRSNYLIIVFLANKAFFSNYCLNFLKQYDLYLIKEILWAFTTIINLQKVLS